MGVIIIATIAGFVILMFFISLVTWYRKCPSDRIMIIYGRTGGHQAAKCIHGGAKFVWPVIQDYGYISLRPLQIAVNLDNALCKQNIRINVPSVFTVGVSTSPEIMATRPNVSSARVRKRSRNSRKTSSSASCVW